jgi:hypothetical protein
LLERSTIHHLAQCKHIPPGVCPYVPHTRQLDPPVVKICKPYDIYSRVFIVRYNTSECPFCMGFKGGCVTFV